MEDSVKALETLRILVDRYRLNKTNVPEQELKTKYRVSFQNLVSEMQDLLREYMNEYVFGGIEVRPWTDGAMICEMEKDLEKNETGRKIREAVMDLYDLDGAIRIAQAQRGRLVDIYFRHRGWKK